MPVYLQCPKCKSDQKLSHKKCVKCGKLMPRQNRTYRIVVCHDKKVKVKYFTGALEEARKIATKIKSELDAGTYFNLRKSPTLNQVWNSYSSWSQEMTKSWKISEYVYNANLKARFGDEKLNNITTDDIDHFIKELTHKKRAPKGIRNVIGLLSRLYNHASKRGQYKGQNPIKNASLPAVPTAEPRYLSKQEVTALWNACEKYPDPQIGNFIKFVILTGRRRSEVLNLLWRDVDLQRGVYTIRNTKIGNPKETYHLTQKAISILKKHPRTLHYSYVFSIPNKRSGQQKTEINTPWRKLRTLAGLGTEVRLHDLRHTVASQLLSKGNDLYSVMEVLGHKSFRSTMRYAHLTKDAKKRIIQAMDELVPEEAPASEKKA